MVKDTRHRRPVASSGVVRPQPIRFSRPLPSDDRLAFREWAAEDAELVLEACRDADIHAWTSMPAPSLEAAEDWIRRQPQDREAGVAAYFAIVERSSDSVVGNVGFVDFIWKHSRAEAGYWILPRRRGCGYAADALRMLTAATFSDLPIERVDLLVDPPNEASRRVAEKAGYRYEGRLRSFRVYRGERADLDSYARLRDDEVPG